MEEVKKEKDRLHVASEECCNEFLFYVCVKQLVESFDAFYGLFINFRLNNIRKHSPIHIKISQLLSFESILILKEVERFVAKISIPL